MKGMKIDASDTARAVDVLTKAFTTSNTDLQMLGEAFKYVGPIATSSGSSLEETTAMIQILSDAGIQASMAGTTLRQLFTSLRAQRKRRARRCKLGVSIYDAGGKMRPMNQIVDSLNAATAGMSDEAKNAALSHIAETRSLSGLIELMAAGGEKIRAKKDVFGGSGGWASQVAAVQIGHAQGTIRAIQGLGFRTGDRIRFSTEAGTRGYLWGVRGICRSAGTEQDCDSSVGRVVRAECSRLP